MPLPFSPKEFRHGQVALVALLLSACATTPVQPPLPPMPNLPPPADFGSFGNFNPPADRVHYLACPINYCLGANETTDLLPKGAGPMRDVLRRVLDAQPRMLFASSSNEGLRLTYRQFPPPPGRPAIVTVEIVDMDETSCGIAIYSESEGTRDPTADRLRVHVLLSAIREAAGA